MKPSTNPPALRAKKIKSTAIDAGKLRWPDDKSTENSKAAHAEPAATPATGAEPSIDSDGAAGPALASISAEEGLRYYAAIIGREPTVDPEAPDLLPGMSASEEAVRGWADDISRVLRDEIARTLHMKLKRRPTWREIMEVMTQAAGRRLDEARKRLSKKDAA